MARAKKKPELRVIDTVAEEVRDEVGIPVPDDVQKMSERKRARIARFDGIIQKMKPKVDACWEAKLGEPTYRKWSEFVNTWDLEKEELEDEAYSPAMNKLDEVQAELAHWQGLLVQKGCGPFGVERLPAKDPDPDMVKNPLDWLRDKLTALPPIMVAGAALLAYLHFSKKR